MINLCRPPVFLSKRIDNYMPILDWLVKFPALHGRMLTPIPTKNGSYKAETDNDVYVLFLFVHGELPKVQGMTYSQTVELAEILAHLHNASEIVSFETHGLDEDISLDFCKRLTLFFDILSKEMTLSLNLSPLMRKCFVPRLKSSYIYVIQSDYDILLSFCVMGTRTVIM